MKFLYIHNEEITSIRANLVQVLSMCNAFRSLGINIELALPNNKQRYENPDEYILNNYGINNKLRLSYYKRIRFLKRLSMLGSYFGVRKLLKTSKADVYYTRDPLIFTLVAKKKLPVIFEAHNSKMHINIKILDRYWTKKVVESSKRSNCIGFISISNNLAKYWKNNGVPQEKLLTLHDGFNDHLFEKKIDSNESRERLNLPKDKKIISYTGSLNPDRDIEKIIKIAKYFPDELILIVGGPLSMVEHYRNLTEINNVANILFTGPVDHRKIPQYLYASDVLLAIWSDKVPTINYCSPLKIFEYMATGRIIIADNFPTIREVIKHEENGLLVSPWKLNELVEQVRRALYDRNLEQLGERARIEAFEKYTWNKRAKEIIKKIENPSKLLYT